jgi:hypothetical protein
MRLEEAAVQGRTGRVAHLLVIALGVALAVSCSAPSPPPDPGPFLDPAESFRRRTCFRCHGRHREGTEIGPPLKNLGEHWSEPELMRYITDPAWFRKNDARVQQLVRDYRGRIMKGYQLSEPELRNLARWLLDDTAASKP